MADAAITLVRDNGQLLPLKHQGTVDTGLPYQHTEEIHNRLVTVIFSYYMRMESGRAFERALRMRVPDANVIYVDPRTAGAMAGEVLTTVQQAQAVVAAVYVVPNSGQDGEFGRVSRCNGEPAAEFGAGCGRQDDCDRDGQSLCCR